MKWSQSLQLAAQESTLTSTTLKSFCKIWAKLCLDSSSLHLLRVNANEEIFFQPRLQPAVRVQSLHFKDFLLKTVSGSAGTLEWISCHLYLEIPQRSTNEIIKAVHPSEHGISVS